MSERPSQWVTDQDREDIEYIDPRDIEGWSAYAECGRSYDERFFPVGEGDERQPEVIDEYCRQCPVIGKCLGFALEVPQDSPFGTWGGQTQRQIKALRLRLKRGG